MSTQPPVRHYCPTCNASFTRPQHVVRHMRSHTGERPYKCKECGDQFARSDLLSRHVNKCHPHLSNSTQTQSSRGNKRRPCDQCAQDRAKCDLGAPCARCTNEQLQCTRPLKNSAKTSRPREDVFSASEYVPNMTSSRSRRPSDAGSTASGTSHTSYTTTGGSVRSLSLDFDGVPYTSDPSYPQSAQSAVSLGHVWTDADGNPGQIPTIVPNGDTISAAHTLAQSYHMSQQRPNMPPYNSIDHLAYDTHNPYNTTAPAYSSDYSISNAPPNLLDPSATYNGFSALHPIAQPQYFSQANYSPENPPSLSFSTGSEGSSPLPPPAGVDTVMSHSASPQKQNWESYSQSANETQYSMPFAYSQPASVLSSSEGDPNRLGRPGGLMPYEDYRRPSTTSSVASEVEPAINGVTGPLLNGMNSMRRGSLSGFPNAFGGLHLEPRPSESTSVAKAEPVEHEAFPAPFPPPLRRTASSDVNSQKLSNADSQLHRQQAAMMGVDAQARSQNERSAISPASANLRDYWSSWMAIPMFSAVSEKDAFISGGTPSEHQQLQWAAANGQGITTPSLHTLQKTMSLPALKTPTPGFGRGRGLMYNYSGPGQDMVTPRASNQPNVVPAIDEAEALRRYQEACLARDLPMLKFDPRRKARSGSSEGTASNANSPPSFQSPSPSKLSQPYRPPNTRLAFAPTAPDTPLAKSNMSGQLGEPRPSYKRLLSNTLGRPEQTRHKAFSMTSYGAEDDQGDDHDHDHDGEETAESEDDDDDDEGHATTHDPRRYMGGAQAPWSGYRIPSAGATGGSDPSMRPTGVRRRSNSSPTKFERMNIVEASAL